MGGWGWGGGVKEATAKVANSKLEVWRAIVTVFLNIYLILNRTVPLLLFLLMRALLMTASQSKAVVSDLGLSWHTQSCSGHGQEQSLWTE